MNNPCTTIFSFELNEIFSENFVQYSIILRAFPTVPMARGTMVDLIMINKTNNQPTFLHR
jgi:hypothetical protein